MTSEQLDVETRSHVHWFVRVCAFAIPVCVFPSSLWRLVEVVPNEACHKTAWDPYYVTALSLVSMAASVMCVGLVRRWGEVVPNWVPVVGGRSLSVRVVTVAASTGITALAVLAGSVLLNELLEFREPPVGSQHLPGCPPPSERPEYALIAAAYAPLPLWLPLLVIVTVAYYRRRTR